MMQQGAIKVIVLSFVTCGLYAWYYLYTTAQEMNARGAEVPPFWHFFIPILNVLWLWKWMKGVEQVTQGKASATTVLLLWIFFFPGSIWIVQNALNEVA